MAKKSFFVPMAWTFELVISSLAYIFLFYLNDYLTAHLYYGTGVNWIYLPAGLRLFLTLIFGFSGAVGIALASFFISYYGAFSSDLIVCIGTSLISGYAPYLARLFVLHNIRLEPDLSNLNFPNLCVCILVYALLSAGLHQWWFATMGLANAGTFNHFTVMVFGDILGSLLLIVVAKSGMDLLKRFKQTAR